MKATDVLERCRAGAAEVQQLDQRLNRLLSCGADPATIERDVLKCRHALDERARRPGRVGAHLERPEVVAALWTCCPTRSAASSIAIMSWGRIKAASRQHCISRCGRIRRRNAAVWRWWNSWMTAASQRFCLRGISKWREVLANDCCCAAGIAGGNGLRRWCAGEPGIMGASHFTQRCGAFLLPFFTPHLCPSPSPCLHHVCPTHAPYMPHFLTLNAP